MKPNPDPEEAGLLEAAQTRSLADAMASPPAAAAVEEAMAWRPPPSPGEEQRVMDRAYAEYVLPDDELNRLRNAGAKSPRKPNGSPPRKAGPPTPRARQPPWCLPFFLLKVCWPERIG